MIWYRDQLGKRLGIGSLASLLLASVMVLIAMSLSATGVAADGPTPLPLELKVDGSDDPNPYFNVGKVVPGSHGEREIELSNEGTEDGAALIHIPGIIDDENGIIEPELDAGDDPDDPVGELSENLWLRITADLNDNGSFETLVAEDYASELEGWEQFIGILGSGRSIPIKFHWSVGWEVGNIIQSDTCIFDIMFILTEILPPILECSNLQVPEKGYYCQVVPISVDARNVGHSPEDFYITLEIRDAEGDVVHEETISVTLDPFKKVTVHFTWHPEEGSPYTVICCGLSDTIEVLRPPELDYSNLEISPSPANVCDTVTISAEVHNIGDETGTFMVIATVDGWWDSQIVTVDPCQTLTLDFTWHADEAGTYTVTVGPLEGELVVLAPTPTPTPTPPPGGGGGGGGGGSTCPETFVVKFQGEITEGRMQLNGRLCEDLEAPSPDEMHRLEMERGTRTVDSEGNVVKLIEITEVTSPPLSLNTVLVGSAYDFSPSGINFDRPVRLTLSYPVGELPGDTLSVDMAYYTEETGWTELEAESSQVAEIGSLTSVIEHVHTIFGILAKVPPGQLTLTSLSVSPREVESGEEVTVTVEVANLGVATRSRTIELWIEDEPEDSRDVTLAAAAAESVTFTVSREESGTYRVAVDGLTGEFEVAAPGYNYWPLIGGILGGLLLAGALTYLLLRWRAAERKRHEEVIGGQV